MGWHQITEAEKENIACFIDNAYIYYVDEVIQDKAIELKQQHKIPIPDAIIGATAVLYDFIVVTRNEDDFRKIEGLEIYNPFSD